LICLVTTYPIHACQLFSFLAGKPYVVLLFNLLLATCDRFIYTKWPLFHKIHITVFRVVAAQMLCSVAIFLAVSYDQVIELKQIRCGKLFSKVLGALAELRIVTELIVYFMAREDNPFNENASGSTSVSTRRMRLSFNQLNQTAACV
jgi:hypothetical protein